MSTADVQTEPAAAVETLSTREIRWQIDPHWRDVLLGPDGLRWDQWRRERLIQIVKQGAHRTVYLVDLPGAAFYLKHAHPRGWGAAAANWIRGSAARREMRNTREFLRRGLPTAEPIAAGEARGRRESFFVSRAIENACTLDEFSSIRIFEHDAAERTGARRRVIVALAELCAAAHRAGVEHADFHAGNVLVEFETTRPSGNAAPRPRLYWIDLPKMRFSAPLDARRSCASLAILAAGWLHRTTRTERQRFWRAYLAARDDLLLYDQRILAAEVVQLARAHSRKTLAGRDKRALASNRDFYRLTGTEFVAHAVRDARPDELTEWIRAACSHWNRTPALQTTMFQAGVTSQVKWIGDGAPKTVLVRAVKPRRNWARIFGLPPAIGQWRLANALRARGIHAPRPLCATQPVDPRRSGFLVTEDLAATPLDHLLPGPAETAAAFGGSADHGAAGPDASAGAIELAPAVRRAVAAAVGQLLGELHAWNFTLPWPGAAAVSISGFDATTGDAARPVVWLVGLAGVELHKRLTDKRRAFDLQLFLDSLILHRPSRTDCLRCLLAYLRSEARAEGDWKRLWNRVYRGSMFEEIAESRIRRRAELVEAAAVRS